MEKIWMIGRTVYTSEKKFKKNAVNTAQTIRVFNIEREISAKEYREELDNQFKVLQREERLGSLLDDDDHKDSEFKLHNNLLKIVKRYSDKMKSYSREEKRAMNIKTWNGSCTGILNHEADLDMVRGLVKNRKHHLLYTVCQSVEDYETVLRYYSFRSLPTYQVRSKERNHRGYFYNMSASKELIESQYPDNWRMFNEAKLKIKNEKTKRK